MGKLPICVRRMRKREVGAVFVLWEKLNALHVHFDPWYATQAGAARLVEAYLVASVGSRDKVVYVATANGRVIGFAHAILESRPPIFVHGRILRILDIYVEEEWRSNKNGVDVGEALITSARVFGRRHDAAFLVAHVAQRNEITAKDFWMRIGFTPLTTCLAEQLEENDGRVR